MAAAISNNNHIRPWKSGIRFTPIALGILAIITISFYWQLQTLILPAHIEKALVVVMIAVTCLLLSVWSYIAWNNKRNAVLTDEEIFRQTKNELERISNLIEKNNRELEAIQSAIVNHQVAPDKETTEIFNAAKRIIWALEDRYGNLNQSLATGDQVELYRAFEEASEPLEFNQNAHTSVFGQFNLPDLEPEQWEPTLEVLVNALQDKRNKSEDLELIEVA